MTLNFDFDWFGNPKATGNLLANVAAAFVVAFLATLPDATMPFRARCSAAGVTAGIAFATKLSRRPSDVAADALLRDGQNPGRRAADRVPHSP